jgi:hypothetical protein
MATPLQVSVVAAIAGGVIAGVVGGIIAGRWLASRGAARSIRRPSPSVWAYAGAAVAGVPSLVLSFVVGGNLGGGWGEALFGIPGIAVGMLLGITVVLAVGIAAGYFFGSIVVSRGTSQQKHEA